MKIDKNAKIKTINAIKKSQKSVEIIFEKTLKDFRMSETEKDIQNVKTKMLLGLIDAFPLGVEHCYYCYKYYGKECEIECTYGKLHGVCIKDNSSYGKVRSERFKFYNLIKKRYGSYTRKVKVINSIVEDLCHNISLSKKDFSSIYDRNIIFLKNSTTENSFHDLKKLFIMDLINNLPFSGNHCYYCFLLNNDRFNEDSINCNKCYYGKKHGICINENSVFNLILKQREKFINSIRDNY